MPSFDSLVTFFNLIIVIAIIGLLFKSGVVILISSTIVRAIARLMFGIHWDYWQALLLTVKTYFISFIPSLLAFYFVFPIFLELEQGEFAQSFLFLALCIAFSRFFLSRMDGFKKDPVLRWKFVFMVSGVLTLVELTVYYSILFVFSDFI